MEKSCYNQPMLSRDFQKLIETDTVAAARALLGMQLILNGQKLGRIVETEAYLGSQDSACHSAGGRRSPKNESMYLPAGHWYVYQIYGYQMLNLVTKAENVAEAVLIRALELPDGRLLANGPGKLTKYAGIDKRFDGESLATSSLQLAHDLTPNRHVSKVPKRGLLDDEDTWKKE